MFDRSKRAETGREEKKISMPFSHFPWQWQLQTYWTLNPPLTTRSPASPSPQSQSHWLPGRRARWDKKSNFFISFFTRCLFHSGRHTCPYTCYYYQWVGWLISWSVVGGCHSDEMEDGVRPLSFGGSLPGDGSGRLQIPGAASREVGRLNICLAHDQ